MQITDKQQPFQSHFCLPQGPSIQIQTLNYVHHLWYRTHSFYNIPSTIGRAPSPGIGKGSKTAIINSNLFTPSPQVYNIQSAADLSKRGIQFGLGREVTFPLVRKSNTMGFSIDQKRLILDTTNPEAHSRIKKDLRYTPKSNFQLFPIRKILGQTITTR